MEVKGILKSKSPIVDKKNERQFTSIDSYKPSGNIVYSKQMLQKIQDKSQNN